MAKPVGTLSMVDNTQHEIKCGKCTQKNSLGQDIMHSLYRQNDLTQAFHLRVDQAPSIITAE